KAADEPWLDVVRIDWTPVFLPSQGADGYALSPASVDDALKRAPKDGGWRRTSRPTLVCVYDAGDAAHLRALRAAADDARVRTASKFFECFRVDAAPRGADGPRFLVYGADGALAGEVAGAFRPGRLYELLEKAYPKRGALGSACDALDPLLKGHARCLWAASMVERAVACPDCGELRVDHLERLAELKARRDEYAARIADVVSD
ncbi:MAG TPA: hypothetical protein VEI02_07065, partial [Planctomycetota bacterium]|nr:hypothetical protein [Planctomycetota bacterium]